MTTTPPEVDVLTDEERDLLHDFSTKARTAESLAVQVARLAAARGTDTPSLPELLTEFALRDEDAAQARRKWLGYREAQSVLDRPHRRAHAAEAAPEEQGVDA